MLAVFPKRFRLLAAFALVAFSVALRAEEAPRHVIFTWQGDTGTTLTVNFQTYTAEPMAATVYWDTISREGMVEDYRHQATGRTFRIPGLEDRWIHRIELTGLAPGGTIYVCAGSADAGISREYKVRTLPHDGRPLRLVTGGDMGPSYLTRKLLRESAKVSPDVALIGGDVAYANGQLSAVDRWDSWLSYYEEEMVTPEGFAIPVIIGIGNHEVIGGYNGTREKAPFFFGFFGQDENTYFVRKLGANLALYVLDTGHIAAHDGAQTAWLDQAMAAHASSPYSAAIYHIPLYPSHRAFDGERSALGRQHWGPVFDKHGLTVAFENHDHTHKRTPLLKANAISPEGTLYIGDGCWGREGRPITEGGRWYLERASSVPHFWSVDVDAGGLTYRAIDARGRVFDVYPENAPGSVEASEVYSALPRLYTLPASWVEIAPWQAAGPGAARGTSSVKLTNHASRPLEVALAPDSEPEGSKLIVPATATTVAPGQSATWPLSFEATGNQPVDIEDFQVLITARAAGAGSSVETYQDDFDVPPPATP
jgi:hypothetical protein